jgi:drug/metabolite transporter (DMT)-like permease
VIGDTMRHERHGRRTSTSGAALAFAPLSIVQATLASSLIFLAVLADRIFGFGLARRQWAGLALASGGLAVIAVTSGGGTDRQAEFGLAAIIAFQAALLGSAAALLLAAQRGPSDRQVRALMLAAAAGLLFTVTHVGIKAITGAVAVAAGPGLQVALSEPSGIISPLGGLVVLGAVVAFFSSARSLQLGHAVAVIAVTSITGNASAIAAGIVVFGDPLGRGPLEIGVRLAAFAVVVAAAALIPAPRRAAAA